MFRCNYKAELLYRGLKQNFPTRIQIFSKQTHRCVSFNGVLKSENVQFFISLNTQIWKLNSPYWWVSFCPSSLLSLGLHMWSNSPSGRFSWLFYHYCDCRKFSKTAIAVDFYLFSNSCHSKTTGLSCSIKKFNPFFRKHDKIFFGKRSTHFLILASLSFNLETS